MKKSFFCFFILILYNSIHAQYHQEKLFGSDTGLLLLNELVIQYKPAIVLDYSAARIKLYTQIYNVHDTVHCVYSDYTLYLDPTSSDPIGYLFKNGNANGINCEHTFPQSKGADVGNAHSDMHHLFPVKADINEARLNYPYGEIPDNKTKHWYYKTQDLTTIPIKEIDQYSESIPATFEPREDHKGNVARAIFYFFTMYELQSDRTFFEQMKNTLCDWHIKDPVDSAEYERSFLIGSYQENKPNPFVLDCSLAQRTYCPNSKSCQIFSKTTNHNSPNFQIIPNPNFGQFILESDHFFEINSLHLCDEIGMEYPISYSLKSENQVKLNLNNILPGLYFIRLQTNQRIQTTLKFYVQ